jgi:hypothetical protein
MCEQPNTYNTLRFVDVVEGNFLFRGGSPTACQPDPNKPGQCITVFDYDGLTNMMMSKCPPYAQLRPPFYLVVVNLRHMNEIDDIKLELDYFAKHGDRGRVHLWDTNGTPNCYFTSAPGERPRLLASFDQWLPDPLIWRVATLRRMLEPSQLSTPVVVYVHCSGGCDRTGEMIGGYRLRYMGWSWRAMWDEQPCERPLGCDNYRALQWYAHWLNQTLGFSLTDIGDDDGCTDPGGTHKPCSPSLETH